jgi:glucosylceramidase
MVLDTQGGPNWFQNWCVAPVIVDPEKDEVYFTPIYYTLSHFSKFIRPEAKVIALENADKELMVTAAENPDGTIAVVVFNEGEINKKINLTLNEKSIEINIKGQAIQTIVISN